MQADATDRRDTEEEWFVTTASSGIVLSVLGDFLESFSKAHKNLFLPF